MIDDDLLSVTRRQHGRDDLPIRRIQRPGDYLGIPCLSYLSSGSAFQGEAIFDAKPGAGFVAD